MSNQQPMLDKGETKPAPKSRYELTDEEAAQWNKDFESDLKTAQKLTDHIIGDEFIYLIGRCGTRHFPRALLRVLAQANKRRDTKLDQLVNEVFTVTGLSADDHPAARRVMEHLRRKIATYDGPTTFGDVLNWVVDELASYALAVQALSDDHTHSHIEFTEIYRQGYRSAFGGVWDILKDCQDLGATEEEAREIVQTTFIKIWLNTYEWSTHDATASIPTRVRAFARLQAMGWRKARIREKQSRAELSDYQGAKSSRKPSLSFYDNKSYDSAAA